MVKSRFLLVKPPVLMQKHKTTPFLQAMAEAVSPSRELHAPKNREGCASRTSRRCSKPLLVDDEFRDFIGFKMF